MHKSTKAGMLSVLSIICMIVGFLCIGAIMFVGAEEHIPTLLSVGMVATFVALISFHKMEELVG